MRCSDGGSTKESSELSTTKEKTEAAKAAAATVVPEAPIPSEPEEKASPKEELTTGTGHADVQVPAEAAKNASLSNDLVAEKEACTGGRPSGQWSDKKKVCECPLGHIWHTGHCRERSKLSSQAICESSYFHGKWNTKKRYCVCGSGKIWRNQHCYFNYEISDEAACQSERGGGTWHSKLQRCICPRLEVWNEKSRRCIKPKR